MFPIVIREKPGKLGRRQDRIALKVSQVFSCAVLHVKLLAPGVVGNGRMAAAGRIISSPKSTRTRSLSSRPTEFEPLPTAIKFPCPGPLMTTSHPTGGLSMAADGRISQ